MEIVVVGVNHKAAPVAVREHLAFTPAQMDRALEGLRHKTAESVLLSTCNRTEVYAVVPSADVGAAEILSFLAGFHHLPVERFSPYVYRLDGREAVAHLFQVASGLDSMILGEPQVLGQVRRAYVSASASDNAGPILSKVFLMAIKTGKQVRTDTDICRNAVSVSHAAVELAKGIFGSLAGRSVLLIGAGEMAELAARNLLDNGATNLIVANRTYQRAAEMAGRIGGDAVEMARIGEALATADVVISSTGARSFVVNPELVREAMAGRAGRPLFLIDIAVPRDIDPMVKELPGVFLHDIDDLQSVVEANIGERQKAVSSAQAIIEAELQAYDVWRESLQVVPTIRALRGRAEEIRQAELRKAFCRLGALDERQRSMVEALSVGIVNKMLHLPTVKLKSCCEDENGAAYALTLRELFGLEDKPDLSPLELQEQSN